MASSVLEKLRGSLASKTSNAALVVVVIGAAEQVSHSVVATLVPADYAGLALSLLGVVFWGLRWVTSKPLEQR